LPGKANDSRIRGHNVLDLFSNFKLAKPSDYMRELLALVEPLSGPFLVSRTGDEG